MSFSPARRLTLLTWAITLVLPLAAWELTASMWPVLHPLVGVFFTAAAFISAAIGGMEPALAAALLNTVALNWFARVHPGASAHPGNLLWSVLLVTVALMIGYAREKWSAAEMLAGRLSTDLARLRDELESQRSDLKRFQELSVRLSSSLELQKLLNDVLNAIAALQKTDLAMLLLLPNPGSKELRVETYTGFNAEQIRLFKDLPTSFFSVRRRVLIDDIEAPRTYFPYVEAAETVGFRAMFSTPIVNARGDALGVVVTFFRKRYAPPERQLKLVELYARQAANALDNAHLYRNSLETLAAEQRRRAVLISLAEASLQINSVRSLDSLLQVITDQARSIIGAQQAFTTLLARGEWNQSLTCVSVAEGQSAVQFPPQNSEVFMLACNLNKPVRLTSKGSGSNAWRSLLDSSIPRDGWLAAPLLTRDGRNLGLIQLSRKMSGEFSEDDEAILVQLTHMASVAIDNVRLYREAQEQIAETTKAQEALQRSKESMQLAQRAVGIAMWEWDLQSGRLEWSDEICRLHGVQPGAFDGRYETWMETIHHEDREAFHQGITQALAQGEYQMQYRVLFPDRSVHWLETRGQTILIGGVPVRMLGVALDVSSRRQAEEALRNSEKLAATGRLAASIAHEINNPLAAVMNALYIVRTTQGLPGGALDHVRTAESELGRVVHITKQTLGFYRDVTSPVPTFVAALMDEVLGLYNSKLEEKQISVIREYGRVEELRAFPGELRQVLSNLVLNAIEAVAPQGGRIRVRVQQVEAPQGRSGIRATVADNGAGIPSENFSRIFEPFFTTKDSKGTGLGLWVSQGIVHKHGGTIKVRSSTTESRHGTCFIIFLPLAGNERAALAARTSESTLPPKGAAGGRGTDLSVA